MNVEWMYFLGPIDDAPMLVGANLNRQHWGRIHRKFPAVDIETIFIFCKDGRELRLGLLHGMLDREGNRLIHRPTRILNDRPRNIRTAFWQEISKHHGSIWISVGSSVEATGMKRCVLPGWGSCHDRFHSSSRCKQHVAHPSAADVRLVESKGHSVERDNVEGTTVDLDICIEVRTGIHDAPKLMFSRRDLNLRANSAVDGEHALRLFRGGTAALRLQRYFAHQGRSLRPCLVQFGIAKHHDPLLHVAEFRKIAIDAFHY